jgi:hypothetical protein
MTPQSVFLSLTEAASGYRGSTTARGLGWTHQRYRKVWDRVVRSGNAVCTRCLEPIAWDAPWDLDHTNDRTGYLGAAHRRCNQQAGALKGNSPRRASRVW